MRSIPGSTNAQNCGVCSTRLSFQSGEGRFISGAKLRKRLINVRHVTSMFKFSQKVLFKHCDPAGIVFYPRYFEMLNDTVEDFFERELRHPFVLILEAGGIPTVQINATFSAPSRLGDTLMISLKVSRVGHSSVDLYYETTCDKQIRFAAVSTLVYVDESGKSKSWPDTLRQALNNNLQGDD